MTSFVQKFLRCALYGSALLLSSRLVWAQEAPFKPRWDGVERSKRTRPAISTPDSSSTGENAAVYSFDRYSGKLREICNLMELDRRRERLGKVAFDDIRNGSPCKSCRALLKEVVEQCQYRKRVVLRPTPAPKATPPSEPSDGPGEQTPPPSTERTPSTATAIPTDLGAARYPRTDLLDRTSALSAEFYERDAGDGPTFESVKYFTDILIGQTDLTPAERDYFGIFATYLLSAWKGRDESPLEDAGPSREEVRALFDDGSVR